METFVRDYKYRDYYRDAFPHSLLSTRQSIGLLVVGASPLAVSGSIN